MMSYLVVIVAFLAIVVIYLCVKVRFLHDRVIGLGEVVKEQYKSERKILTEIKKAMEAE
jgi:hypothetical protein